MNDALAALFRERYGLEAQAELLVNGVRPDVLVRRGNGPLVVETEFTPARTVGADALSRLGLQVNPGTVEVTLAVKVPVALRGVSQSILGDRLAATTFEWTEWRADSTHSQPTRGGLAELARAVQHAERPSGDLDEAVTLLEDGARSAGAKLYASPGTIARVANIFHRAPSDEVANMGALVVTNALLFQERIASSLASISPIAAAREGGSVSPTRTLDAWDAILEIDYYPIFKMARDIVAELPAGEAAAFLTICAETAQSLLSLQSAVRHDLAGRIFNRLIADREFLAAYYTQIPSATLLAGLALAPDQWPTVDWSSVDSIKQFRLIDPSCGTGTLLMAAYQQLTENSRSATAGANEPVELHKALIEDVIAGADVIQAAIHLTAATLAAMSPAITFGRMNLYTMPFGIDENNQVRLGSLDWLISVRVQAHFSGIGQRIQGNFWSFGEQVTGRGSETGYLDRPQVDLVIGNPPYTRRGSDSGHGEAIARIFSVPQGEPAAERRIAQRTSEAIRNTPADLNAGHGTTFLVLADRILNYSGRIAMVLPVTSISGQRWDDIRQLLVDKYEIEYVVSSHDPTRRSFSFDTDIAEILLVARKLNEGEQPTGRGRFVNLWRMPGRTTEALAVSTAVRVTNEGAVLRFDGPPVGATPLFIGDSQWGEIVEAPVGSGPWSGARWKRAVVGQFATALASGAIWSHDGQRELARIPVGLLGNIANVGPQDRQIHGSLGVFDAHHGWEPSSQFPALWQHRNETHTGVAAEPNARLVPKVGRNHSNVWSGAGNLQVTRDVRYDSQRVMAVRTERKTLGVRAWHSLNINDLDTRSSTRREMALGLWLNSTFGLLLQSNHANRSQQGRGTGNKAMLESIPALDVCGLADWQLEAAEQLWRDTKGKTFKSFHTCAVDPARIELDERLVRDVLGLGDEVVETARRLRFLLASEPSIHGDKRPELP